MSTISSFDTSSSLLKQTIASIQKHDENFQKKFAQLPENFKNKVYKQFWKEMGKPDGWEYGRTTFHQTGNWDKKIQTLQSASFKASQRFLNRSKDEIEEEFNHFQAKDIPYAVSEEYNKLSAVGRKPLNQFLNTHIVPFDMTLVPMKDGSYINANFIFGKQYIATQTPSTPAVIASFWHMVLEQGVKTAVMLNETHDPKFLCYWPTSFSQPAVFGKITLRLLDYTEEVVPPHKNNREPTIIHQRKILVTAPGFKPWLMTHVHHSNWRDGYIPDKIGFSKIVEKVTKAQDKSNAPIIVHCSAGVGRTGTFIATHKGLRNAAQSKKIDVFTMMSSMRSSETGRSPYMIASTKQYLFCHKFLEEFGKKNVASSYFRKKLIPSKNIECSDFHSRLKKIKQLFEQKKPEMALKLFSKVPLEIRCSAYGYMYEAIGSPQNKPYDIGEKTFQDPHYDPVPKVAAIEKMIARYFP